ncbi:TetR/AcrR family transcriptional regulator [Parvibaculum sedimenti]|nr:TetR/AcrR family transcriptional regulator [Parvibaculum sedimenti]
MQKTEMRRRKVRPNTERFEQIAEAAIACFSELGYRRTQVADIAKQTGAAAGTLYLYAESKEALLHLAIMRLCGLPFEGLAAPLPTPPIGETVALLRTAVGQRIRWPALDAALARPSARTRQDLTAIGLELYDTLAAERRAIWLIDRCSLDIPELGELHRDIMHGGYLSALIRLLEKQSDWPTERIAIAVRAALEMVAWTAMHRRRGDRLHTDGITPANESEIRDVATRCFAAALTVVSD